MKTATAFLVLAMALSAGLCALAGEGSVPPASGTAILGSESYLHGFLVFKTPVFVTKGGEVKIALTPDGYASKPDPKDAKPLPDYQSPLPPVNWTSPDFDDSSWDRQRAPLEIAPGSASHTNAARFTAAPNSLICLRGKFLVEDPARVQDLKLSVEYIGGLAVFVNGQELTRANLPAGELKPDTLAEKYPDDLHCLPDGTYLQDRNKDPVAFARRYRKLSDVAVPAKLLRKGANVLAIEIHRSAINETAISARRVAVGGMYQVPGIWAHVGLNDLRLTSGSGAGVVPNVTRPKGIQVWNVAPYGTVTAFDYGDPGEPLPIQVAAARNSVFSGRLVVSSDAAIRSLKAAVNDLKATGGAVFPASAVRVRYCEPATPDKSWAPAERFNGLADVIPAEVPVPKVQPPRGSPPGQVAGAVAPLWFTVRVPQDAKAGKYEGTVTVEAQGLKSTTVPFVLTVNDWTLADPKDFRQHHLYFLSQESVAKHYGVPLWSDKHFELMGKSMALLAEINSREVPMNLAINFYGGNKGSPDSGNAESMVRWVKQADGSFKHDFTVFDKYCDLIARHYGKPLPLRLNCWDEMVVKEGKPVFRGATSAMGVTVVDAATGKLGILDQPVPGTEESFAFWKPVIDEALKKLAARGWLDVTAFGHNSYCTPPQPPVVDIARKLWPEGVWAYTAHNGTLGGVFGGTGKGVGMPCKFSVGVWTEGGLTPRGCRALLKPRPGIWCDTARCRHYDSSPLIVIRNLPEEIIQRGQDGVGDCGGDLFPIRNEQGNRYYRLGSGRGTGGPNDAQTAILAPGPDGAIATERFENFREGTEIGEAILYLEKMLLDRKIGGELEKKVNHCLDERAEVFIRFWYERGANHINRWSPAGQFERDARLLALCGEVAAVAR